MGDNKRDSLARGMKTQKIRKSGTDLVGTRDAGCGSGAPEEEREGRLTKFGRSSGSIGCIGCCFY